MTRVAVTYPVDALVSYHYYAGDNEMRALTSTGRLRLIGDSGAFSAMTQGATIDRDAYAGWVTRWRPHLVWAASLDVIGNAEASHGNWKALRDQYRLPTVPTLHAGADTRWMDVYAAEGVDFLGLGGMAGTGQAPRAFRWAVNMLRYARANHPQMRFHLWGVTNRKFLDALPVYSADSSGALGQAYRYGSLRIFDPATGRHTQVMLKGREVYKIAPLLRRVYGVDPTQIETSHPGNRVILIQLAAAVTQQYALWLQRRHGRVSPPAWGIQEPVLERAHATPDGPVIHVVDTDHGNLGSTTTDPPSQRLPDGPRLHMVAGTGHKQSQGQDIHAAVGAGDGPHLHLVDTARDGLGPGLVLREITDGPTKIGPSRPTTTRAGKRAP